MPRVVIEGMSAEEVAELVRRLGGDVAITVESNVATKKPAKGNAVPTEKRKPGRPYAAVKKSKRSLYLDDRIWQALETLSAKNGDEGISLAANRLLLGALKIDE